MVGFQGRGWKQEEDNIFLFVFFKKGKSISKVIGHGQNNYLPNLQKVWDLPHILCAKLYGNIRSEEWVSAWCNVQDE